MVDMLFNLVCVSTLQMCAWDGCGTPTGFVKHMQSHHADGKPSALQKTVRMGWVWDMSRLCQAYDKAIMRMVSLYTIIACQCSTFTTFIYSYEDYDLIGSPEYKGKDNPSDSRTCISPY